MQLHKTDKARAALLERTSVLSAQDRRILILSDGRRSLDDIVGLLGAGARSAVLGLVERGFLATSEAGAARGPVLAAITEKFRDAGDAGRKPLATPAPTPEIAKPAPAPTATRRSLAATKMYMLDMLQLQRDPEAAAIKSNIQTSTGHEALVAAILQGLQHIQLRANASYGQRVVNRVAEIIPEDALPALQAQRTGSSPASATG